MISGNKVESPRNCLVSKTEGWPLDTFVYVNNYVMKFKQKKNSLKIESLDTSELNDLIYLTKCAASPLILTPSNSALRHSV